MGKPGRIHEGLVGERRLIGQPYLADPELRQQYETEIAPRTEAALAKIFNQFAPTKPVRRVLDLGAGTGAAGRAVRTRFGADIDLVSVDNVPGPGILVADLRRGGRPARVEGRFELVVAAHLLNELGLTVDVGARLVRSWCDDLLTNNGICVILEPAPRETSRYLLQVRDRLVVGGLRVVAPCLRQGSCPALERERDFCHDSADWDRTARGQSRVDFSYLVLQAEALVAEDPDLFRVVSDPMVEKGKRRIYGCGVGGRTVMVRLDRDRKDPQLADFDAIERGNRVQVKGGVMSKDGLRLGVGACVTRKA